MLFIFITNSLLSLYKLKLRSVHSNFFFFGKYALDWMTNKIPGFQKTGMDNLYVIFTYDMSWTHRMWRTYYLSPDISYVDI